MDHSLIGLLSCFLSTNNDTRSEAERTFANAKTTNPREVTLCLATLLANSEQYSASLDPAVLSREGMCALSAVLLRGITLRQAQMWQALAPGEIESCRVMLLQALRGETVSHVQRKIADLVAVHAKLSPWPELLSTVQELACAGTDEKHRQLSMYLLASLAEHIGEFLTAHMESVWGIIAPALSAADRAGSGADQDEDALHSAALAALAVCSVLEETSKDAKLNAEWTSGLERSVRLAASLGEAGLLDEALEDLLGGLLRLAEKRAALFAGCFEGIMQSLLTLAMSTAAENSTRSMALQIATELLTNPQSRPFAAALPGVRDAVLVAIIRGCMAFDASDESTAEFLEVKEIPSNQVGFEDGGESGEGDLAGAAGSCLETVSLELDPKDVLQVCNQAIGNMLNDDDWRARRTSLYILSVICAGTRSLLYQHLPHLIPPLLARTADPHPRVRYAALYCLEELIREFRVADDEDDDDDDDDESDVGEDDSPTTTDSRRPRRGRLLTFQRRFCTVVPSALCKALQANEATPRVVNMVLRALLLFYDPDYCTPSNIDHGLIGGLMQHCVQILSTVTVSPASDGSSGTEVRATTYPLYVVQVAASLVANIGTYLNPDLMRTNYPPLIALLSNIVGDLSRAVNTTARISVRTESENSVSALRGKCLEAAVLVGGAVGLETFRPMAITLLEQLAQLTSAGLDFSDELSSVVTQACVRLAGLLGAEFQPYVSRLLPELISHIAQDVQVEITELDDAKASRSTGGEEDEDVMVVRRRGQAHLRVQYSNYALQEKVMSCRVLYQYTIDIPQFLPPLIPSAIDALVHVMQSMAFGEDCAHVACASVTELLTIFCTYSAPIEANLLLMQASCETALNALLVVAEERNEDTQGGEINRVQCYALSEVRGILQLLYRLRNTFVVPWPVVLPPSIGHRVLLISRDVLTLWMNSNFTGALVEEDSLAYGEQAELGEELRDTSIDNISWTLKFSVCGASVDSPSSARGVATTGPVDVMVSYVKEVLPLLQGVLSTGFSSKAAAPLMLIPTSCLSEAVECSTLPPEVRGAILAELLPGLLTLWEHETLIHTCISGIGVCCQHGNPPADMLSASLQVLVRVLGLDPHAAPVAVDLDADHSAEVQDAAVYSLLRIAVYRQQELGVMMASKLLMVALENFPLCADPTAAGEAHAWLLGLICSQDVRLLGLEEPVGAQVRTACFRAVASLLLTLDGALAKRNQRAAKGTAKGNKGKGKKSIAASGASAAWQIGEEDSFWAKQPARKDVYRNACLIIRAGLKPPVDAGLAECMKNSFAPAQLKTLHAYAEGYLACAV